MSKICFAFLITVVLGTGLAFFQPATAQSDSVAVGRYFTPEAGVSLSKFLDQSFSSLRYQGPVFSGGAGFIFRKPQNFHQVDFLFDYGFLNNDRNNASLTQYQFSGNYTFNKYLRNVHFNLPIDVHWYVGGTLGGLWMLSNHDSFSNNAVINSFYLSLSPSSSLFYNFNLWNSDFTAHVSAFLPLITFAVRPAFGTPRFSGDLDDAHDLRGFLESGKIVSLNKFFRFNASYDLEYHLKNQNALRLRYMWNFYSFKQDDRLVQGASHTLTFSTMFGF